MNAVTDAQVLAFIEMSEAFYPADANGASAADNRRYYDEMCAAFRKPRPADIEVSDTSIGSVPVRFYRPREAEGSRAPALYVHGGGFVVGSLESHDDVCAELASRSRRTVISVDYRLAPEHRYPAQLNDVEEVWRHIAASSPDALVMGDSAGGNLCAALCVRMKRVGGPMPSAQILIYPGLGGPLSLPAYTENENAPMLRTEDVIVYKNVYSDHERLCDVEREEVAPLSATDFAGLPPSWIITADVDPLRDDGRAYAEALQGAGVFARWHNEPQLVHGYLRARHMSDRARQSFTLICDLLVKDEYWTQSQTTHELA